MLKHIKKAADGGDWRAAAEWLRFTFPIDYRRSLNPNHTSINVNTSVQTAVVVDEKRRMEMIAQRQRILKTTSPASIPVSTPPRAIIDAEVQDEASHAESDNEGEGVSASEDNGVNVSEAPHTPAPTPIPHPPRGKGE